jgi:hypothetical protein
MLFSTRVLAHALTCQGLLMPFSRFVMAPDMLPAEVNAPTAVLHCPHSYYSTLPARSKVVTKKVKMDCWLCHRGLLEVHQVTGSCEQHC